MIRGLAHGVSRLHHCTNVIHGDIKPANLILSWEPTRLVLIDFGSAWFAEETAQRHEDPGDGISMRYAAPEQVKHAKSVDFRADQFAVSVIFYELLTLDLPYGGEGGGAGVPEDRATDEPLLDRPSARGSRAHRLPREIWNKIDHVVTRGLALEPGLRYANRREWLDDLDDLYATLKKGTGLGPISRLVARIAGWPSGRKAKG